MARVTPLQRRMKEMAKQAALTVASLPAPPKDDRVGLAVTVEALPKVEVPTGGVIQVVSAVAEQGGEVTGASFSCFNVEGHAKICMYYNGERSGEFNATAGLYKLPAKAFRITTGDALVLTAESDAGATIYGGKLSYRFKRDTA